jgi:hypothetical protein
MLGRIIDNIKQRREEREQDKLDIEKKKQEKKEKEKVMSDLYDTVKVEVDALVKTYKESLSDNSLTLVEAWTLAQHSFTAFVLIAEKLKASGVEKKLVVMTAAERLYDEVLGPLDIKAIPNFIEPTLDKFAKPVYLECVSKAVDYLVNLDKKVS